MRITGVDLNLFDFDYDLTWMAFFMNADGKIYGRYGGRDASGPDSRQTLAGLRFSMQAAVRAHAREPKQSTPPRREPPLYIENLSTAKQYRGCIHCHNVKEIRWAEEKAAGKWDRESIWGYPLPENVGITLDLDRGNLVKVVELTSPADHAGVKAGDILHEMNGYPIHSFADVQYALHRAPAQGEIPISWQRPGSDEVSRATLALEKDWRRTNITWRPSMLDLLPGLRVYGSDLTAGEKKALGLGERRLAFRQEKPVHSQAQEAGIRENDVIVGINDQKFEMTLDEFLGYIRRNYLIGDRITLNVLRDGKKLNVPWTLK